MNSPYNRQSTQSSAYSVDYGDGGGTMGRPNRSSDHMGTIGRMVVDGAYIDGSWELCVLVVDLAQSVRVRVHGDVSLGELMHRTAEATGHRQSWSSHALWWPARNQWLLHTKSSLDQCGIQSDAKLEFRPTRGDLLVVLPSQAVVPFNVNYSDRVFNVVGNICKELNIRYPEEFSLSLPLTKEHLKSNMPIKHTYYNKNRKVTPGSAVAGKQSAQKATVKQLPLKQGTIKHGQTIDYSSPYATLASRRGILPHHHSIVSLESSKDELPDQRVDCENYADCRLRLSARQVLTDQLVMQPKNLKEKARLNCNWLDSAKSLLEQGVRPFVPSPPSTNGNITTNGDINSSHQQLDEGSVVEPPRLNLAVKFYTLYDLNPVYDAVRIHQIYEQARWSILAGQIDCTEDEMIVFAAYQVQAELQSTALLEAAAAAESQSIDDYDAIGTVRLRQQATVDNDYQHQATLSRPSFNPMIGTLPRPSSSKSSSSSSTIRDNISTLGRLTSSFDAPNDRPFSTIRSDPSSFAGSTTGDHHGNGHYVSQQPTLPPLNDELDELLSGLEQSCGVADEPHSATRQLRREATLVSPGALGPASTLPILNRSYNTIDNTDHVPILQTNVRVFRIGRGKIMTIKRYKTMLAVIEENCLRLYPARPGLDADSQAQPLPEPTSCYALRGCRAVPDVRTSNEKYVIKLKARPLGRINRETVDLNTQQSFSTSTIGRNQEELWIRFDTPDLYANWMAAFHLGSAGKTLASQVAFNAEVKTILDNLALQVPGPTPVLTSQEAKKLLGDLRDFCTVTVIHKVKSKDQLRSRISETHANIVSLSLLDAKLRYIQAWQRLNNFGRSYFLIKFTDESIKSAELRPGNLSGGGLFSTPIKDDLFAISPNRIEVVNQLNGEIVRAWNLDDMSEWITNWEINRITLTFVDARIKFDPLSTNCKTINEFIGGYAILKKRSPETGYIVNEREFHRSTGFRE